MYSFEPISTIVYSIFNPDRQLLVCCSEETKNLHQHLREKWEKRACAVFGFGSGDSLQDVIRDLLANPQIRTIVFEGSGSSRNLFSAFWASKDIPNWGINAEHITVVRQFVDLYDHDCSNLLLQPFWPTRIKYEVSVKEH